MSDMSTRKFLTEDQSSYKFVALRKRKRYGEKQRKGDRKRVEKKQKEMEGKKSLERSQIEMIRSLFWEKEDRKSSSFILEKTKASKSISAFIVL